MKPKLEALIEDQAFGIGSKSVDTGVMVNQYGDVVIYMILEYWDCFEVYLNLYDDEGDPPYRNILAKGIADTIENAKNIAVENLNKLVYKNGVH